MNLRRELEKRAEKKKEEIRRLEDQLATAKAYLDGMLDSLKLIPKFPGGEGEEKRLREGSDLAKARDVIKKAGHPMHILKILQAIQKETTKSNRLSLSGSLSGYARKEQIFTRPAANTFGLKEFEATADFKEPPDDFGVIPNETGTSKEADPPKK